MVRLLHLYSKLYKLTIIMSQKLYMIPVIMFLVLFINMNLIVQYFKTPWVIGTGVGVVNSDSLATLVSLTIIGLLLFFIKIFSSIILDTIKNRTDLKDWLKRIVSVYLVVIIVFAMNYTYLLFISDFVNSLKSMKYYAPTVITNSQKQNKFIENINKYKNSMEISSFKRSKDKGRICKVALVTLSNESIKNLNRFNSNVTLGNKIQAVNMDYQSLLVDFIDMIYFSTITITTVGYGDIYPVSILAKIVTCIELLLGQFLIVISIGRAFYYCNPDSINK